MPKYRSLSSKFSVDNTVRHRELGLRKPLGFEDKFSKKVLSSILPCASWEHVEDCSYRDHGGVFNLEFSQDGSLLVAACEKKSILMFDPLCRRLIHCIDNAHRDCVNCVRFLDSRVFATCSDDSTVALWDARNLKNRIRTLHGHSNWVKNIEFSSRDDLLVTSGFDGSIYTWDINSYTESGFLYNRVFHTNGLMRTRLNPDASKMIICTTGGYIIIIHDLDLHSLPTDLYGFKPNMYRLMQLSQATIPMAVRFNHLFSRWRRRNRVEFVTDFPVGDDAEVVSSLQVHPQGWAVLSRNISNDETSEWSCVHDIQEREISSEDEDFDPREQDKTKEKCVVSEEGGTRENSAATSNAFSQNESTLVGSSSGSGSSARSTPPSTSSPSPSSGSTAPTANGSSSSRGEESSTNGGVTNPVRRNRNSQYMASADVWEALLAIRDARILRGNSGRNSLGVGWSLSGRESGAFELGFIGRSGRGTIPDRSFGRASINLSASGGVRRYRPTMINGRGDAGTDGERSENGEENSEEANFHGFPEQGPKPTNTKIHKNIPRLTHYCEEPNVGRGFIKELCFGAGGRLICSPFGFGVRLLAFSPDCSELCAVVPPKPPIMLYEVASNICHTDIVVSTKFSPTHCLLVSGCLKGKIVWYEPIL